MTTAQKIAHQFNDDGQCWDDGFGLILDEVCREHTSPDYRDGHGTDVLRFTFPDDSVITIAGAGWDFGYPGCYCWQGAGHQGTACPDSPDHDPTLWPPPQTK